VFPRVLVSLSGFFCFVFFLGGRGSFFITCEIVPVIYTRGGISCLLARHTCRVPSLKNVLSICLPTHGHLNDMYIQMYIYAGVVRVVLYDKSADT
jgi:hypothetical protein